MENTFNAKYNRFFYFFFYSGWAAIWIASLFRHTKAFLWTGDILLFISLVCLIKSNRLNIFSLSKTLSILLGIFLICLLWFVIISPYPSASLEAFLLNYFFHISLFFLVLIIILISNSISFIFWLIPCIAIIASIVYDFSFVFITCNLNLTCALKSGLYLLNSHNSIFKGLVITSPVYVFGFFIFLGLFLKSTGYKKLIFGVTSLSSLLAMLWLGRRAALLGCFIAFIILLFLSKKKSLKILSLGILLVLIIVTIAVLNSPYGKDILIRSDNVQLLFSGEYEKFDEAGSLGQRLYVWPKYFKKALEHPFSGTGIARRVQKRVLSTTELGAPLEHSHNLFLNLWLQAGLHTSLVFLTFYLLSFYKCYNLWKFSGEDYFIGGLLLFLIGFFIMSFFEGLEEGTRFTTFWIANGLAWGYAQKRS